MKMGFYSAGVRISTKTVADLGLEFDPSEEKQFEEYLKRGGPLNLLEAVYCDPCKAKVRFLLNFAKSYQTFKVVCSLVTQEIWPEIRLYIDPSSKYYDPNDPTELFAFTYLDSDNDGKLSVEELYDGRVVEILRSIFDGLDVNGNGVLEKSEAIPENLFGPKFIRNIIAEIFKVADRNKDTSLTVDDAPPLYCRRWEDCHKKMNPDCHQIEDVEEEVEQVEECYRMFPSRRAMAGKLKLNKPEDYCYTLYRSDSYHGAKLQECKNQISTYLPLLDQ